LAALRRRLKRGGGEILEKTVFPRGKYFGPLKYKRDLLKICAVRKICGRIFGIFKRKEQFFGCLVFIQKQQGFLQK
jgi:hypothetical protein